MTAGALQGGGAYVMELVWVMIVAARPSASRASRPLRTALYAGVFDPPTLAHVELIETALKLFDRLIVVVAVNPSKSAATMFSTEARVDLLRASLAAHVTDRVVVQAYAGLIAPLAERLGACALVRGMRPVTDPDYEIALGLMNAKLAPSLPTVLLVARADHVYLSSTFVRDTARLDGLIVAGTVPRPVEDALRDFVRENGPASSTVSGDGSPA